MRTTEAALAAQAYSGWKLREYCSPKNELHRVVKLVGPLVGAGLISTRTNGKRAAHPSSSATIEIRALTLGLDAAPDGSPLELGRQALMHRHRHRSTLQHRPNGMPVE